MTSDQISTSTSMPCSVVSNPAFRRILRTASRDKVTRVQHLGTLGMAGQPADQPRFEVVACIAGRGFGERREDMKKLLLATRGKVFTLQNLHQLVEHTRLADFRSR